MLRNSKKISYFRKSLILPKYPYALTKRLAEQIIFHFGNLYNIPVVSLRLFNVYGPRARTSGTYGAVFGVFLAQKLAKKPFTVVGDGNQTRDFTFIDDVVDAFVEMLSENIKNEIFNVGSGQTYSVNSLVKLLGDNKVVYIPKRPGEPDCTFADISKILKKLDGDLKFHLKMALKNLWNLLMILKMPQFGIHYPLKMKQKIGLNIFLKLDFVNNEK